ncbi:MAG TPA: hypothetical protein VMG08_12210 [Allosphingosinicella sp.]|nr:hypothetical protein [Allosphingosinicella sp.]
MLAAALLLLLTETFPATLTNPGFARGMDDWGATGHRGYRAEVDSNYPARPRRQWLSAGWAARSAPPRDSDYQVFTFVDARRYRGRRVRFSAEVRTRGQGASLVAMANGARTQAAVTPSSDWRRQGVVLQVPSNADIIQVGFRLRGGGGFEADNARLEILR